MNAGTVARLERGMRRIGPQLEVLIGRFYDRLFEENPRLRPLFPAHMFEQRKMLEGALLTIVENLHAPARLREPLLKLGGQHASYGVLPEQYPIFRDTLVSVIAEAHGDDWTDQIDADWHAALDHVSEVMLEGHKMGAASTPDDGA